MDVFTLLEKFQEEGNLVPHIDDDTLTSIGRKVVEDFDIDKGSRAEWEKNNEESHKLASQVCDTKNWPWPNAANVKYPLITLAAIQFAARAYPALITETDSVKARIIGTRTTEKEERAKRVGKHMTYQLHEEMEEWAEDTDKLLHYIPIVGTAYKKTYFDPSLQRNKSELVLAKDLVINYYAKSVDDAARKTHVLYFSPNQIEERMRSKLWERYDLSTDNDIDSFQLHGTSDKAQGLAKPAYDDDSSQEFLEQHTWWDLDDDGYQEPYVITVHSSSMKVVRIVPRYSEDSIFVDEDGEITRIQAHEFFTKFGFIPDSESGVYDFGFGRLLGPINETVNTTINQLLDAGSLSNLQSGFLGRGARLKGGMSTFKPGEWKVVNSTGDDLRKNVFPLPIREPSNVLFQLLGMMIDAGQRVGSVSDIMMGENPGQNQPFSTTQRVLEEGMRVFSSIHKRLHRSFKKEYKKLFILNSRYLDPEAYFTIMDPRGEQEAVVWRSDYDVSNLDVVPASDPDVVSESMRLAKAEALMQLATAGLVNPQVATIRYLEAQNQSGIEELLQMPPPQPNFDQQIEMQRLQIEQMRVQLENERELFKAQTALITAKANAILALAKAEAEDDKTTIEALKAQVDAINAERDRIVEMGKIQAQRESKNESKRTTD